MFAEKEMKTFFRDHTK